MIRFLFILAMFVLAAGVVCGCISGTLPGFPGSVVAGAALSGILFTLSHILENRQKILFRLELLEQQTKKPPKVRPCERCGKTYEDTRSGCPYCGNHPQ